MLVITWYYAIISDIMEGPVIPNERGVQMRFTPLALLLFVIASSLYAEWQPSIHGTPSSGYIASDSSGNRIIVNMHWRAGVWMTDDGGLNWTQINDRITEEPVVSPVPYCDIVSVGAAADTMIINMYHGNGLSMHSKQFHTLDGGVSWSSFQDVVTEFWPDSIQNMIFWDPAIVLSDRIYYSREDGFGISYDDGETWDIIGVGQYHQGLNDADFDEHNPDVIFMYGSWGGQGGGVIGSYDGGHTWAILADMEDLMGEVDEGFITDFCRGHDDHVYAAAYWIPGHPVTPVDPFLHSSDLGATWECLGSEGLPAHMNVKHIQAVPEVPGRLLTAGHYDAGVWESEDGGETWHRLLRGLPERPTVVETFYRNPHSGHIYICIAYFGIWRSTDLGDTWHEVPSPPIGMAFDSYYDLALIAGEGGMLNGYHGTGLFYAAGDATVFQRVPEFDNHQYLEASRYPISFTPDMLLTSTRTRDLWTLEREQQIVYSEDEGQNWEQISCGFSGTYATTAVETDSGLVIVGTADASSVHVSHDLGQSWQEHDTDFSFQYVLLPEGTDLYTLRYDPYDLVKSSDLGETWEAWEFPEPDELYGVVSPILAIDDTLFVRAGEICWAYIPDVMGYTWQQRGEITSRVGTVFFDWDVVSTPADTFLVGSSRMLTMLFTSHDNGWTWEDQYLEMPGFYQGEVVVELEYDPWRDRLWLSTNMGLAYLDDPTMAVGEDVWVFQPATYFTVNAYPNPFNSMTSIEYTIQKPGEVKVAVYDLLGRHVTTLYNGLRTPGTHQAQFDASDLASGSYFLRLEADEQTVNRKLTLVK
jgi:photosystem II stability/assembly factor-like uncharacterized protein